MGETQARGVEFDIRGKISRGFSVMANYAFTESKVTEVAKDITCYTLGDIIPGYATHTLNRWFDYDFLDGALKNSGISTGVGC